MRRELVLVIDVGGSSLKANLFFAKQNDAFDFVLPSDCIMDIDASSDRAAILTTFSDLFKLIIRALSLEEEHYEIIGISLAFPGPADYEHGIPLMQGLAKYEALYGSAIRDDLVAGLKAAAEHTEAVRVRSDLLFTMQNDARMYALGAWIAEGRPQDLRIAALTVGTGLGSAFIVNGELMTDRAERNRAEGIPADGYIYHLPLDGLTADDCLSTRGLVRLARNAGLVVEDGRALAEMAEAGDRFAEEVFIEFGERLAAFIAGEQGLAPFRADVVYLGGNLMRAFDRMHVETHTPLKLVVDSRHPLVGGAAYWMDKYSSSLKERIR